MRLEEFQPGQDGHVSDGVPICKNCNAWYPIDRDVLEFVPPPLLDRDDLATFSARFSDRLDALGLKQPLPVDPVQAGYADQVKQREHFDLYAEEVPGFKDYTLIPFIRATATRYVRLAGEQLKSPRSWLLDIGCGNGLQSYPLIDKCTLIGFDVSRKAVRRSAEGARALGLMKTSTFFVGDGSHLPFFDASFEQANTLGVLHHLPDPRETVADIQRILKPGGIHFAVENNKSAFRKIFDLLMMVWPLWVEEAGSQPLISREMVAEWTKDMPVRVESQTSIFLPPQLVNLLGKMAIPVVEWSDRLFSLLPVWRLHGGQLIFTVQKLGAK